MYEPKVICLRLQGAKEKYSHPENSDLQLARYHLRRHLGGGEGGVQVPGTYLPDRSALLQLQPDLDPVQLLVPGVERDVQFMASLGILLLW